MHSINVHKLGKQTINFAQENGNEISSGDIKMISISSASQKKPARRKKRIWITRLKLKFMAFSKVFTYQLESAKILRKRTKRFPKDSILHIFLWHSNHFRTNVPSMAFEQASKVYLKHARIWNTLALLWTFQYHFRMTPIWSTKYICRKNFWHTRLIKMILVLVSKKKKKGFCFSCLWQPFSQLTHPHAHSHINLESKKRKHFCQCSVAQVMSGEYVLLKELCNFCYKCIY